MSKNQVYREVCKKTIICDKNDIKNFQNILNDVDRFIDKANGIHEFEDDNEGVGTPTILTIKFTGDNNKDMFPIMLPIIPACYGELSEDNLNSTLKEFKYHGTKRIAQEKMATQREQLMPVIEKNRQIYHRYIKLIIMKKLKSAEVSTKPSGKQLASYLSSLDFKEDKDKDTFSNLIVDENLYQTMETCFKDIINYKHIAAHPQHETEQNKYSLFTEFKETTNNFIEQNDYHNRHKSGSVKLDTAMSNPSKEQYEQMNGSGPSQN